ncbi:MAG TPA: hypothetical protein VF794_24110 [Archangium sp.]|uniref:hypothetical protein n=1 Tax=Archangium sp. TaxID=1872627 RepID=UPI002ED79448
MAHGRARAPLREGRAFQLRNGQWVELGSWSGNDRVRAEPFEAIELELEVLWLSEAPPP